MSINNIHGYIFTTCRFIEFFQGSGIRVVPLGGFKEQSVYYYILYSSLIKKLNL